ncbi:uveal autoantigen with coiled-coil domains and ankyrin repeats protein [Frieseomelitta varia]|uniref:uveal autoantigen with coiled-coil domains and ankyrin repeats protein n=1 Tax=Frieseomelitta varia TaxID=561572 RepID=UPI001CB6AA1D|nr:uveal autoantigen with coiled-coil domains and ankyrin repeats protein [Frieseomelitta varia]
MKKRRPWNTSRSSADSPSSLRTRELDGLPVKIKSFHDLKRLKRDSPKLHKKNAEFKEPSLKRDAFGSLESLFDLKKPLNLPDVCSLTIKHHQEGHIVPFKSKNPKNSKTLLKLLSLQQVELEPHILERTYEIDDFNSTSQEIKQESNFETLKTLKDTENFDQEDKESEKKMAEEDVKIQEVPDENVEEDVQEVEEDIQEIEDVQEEFEEVEEPPKEKEEIEELEERPPSYPLPPGVGEGAPIKPGGRNESILSSSPLTDSAVMMEMKRADDRCLVLAKEIEQLKQEIATLTIKKDLTDEDTLIIHEKQDEVMKKLTEFEQITRKLQRLLGLSDISSTTFAKMFDMHPVMKPTAIIAEEEEFEIIKEKVDMIDKKTDVEIEKLRERFDLPQIEYPEDKLPRVIVCGNTEDEIPKIVVADSKKKGKDRCLQSLTGKLTESLTMQEKLVLENAQLEGGKYKLEEALLEKDTAVESLQRKVCGLQAEMRIVVKENVELTRQLACLNQRITSPCCYTPCCPGGISSEVSSPSPLRSISYTNTLQQDDDYCRCKCCVQPQIADTLSPDANTVCVRLSHTYLPSGDSPRLAGGASITGVCVTSGASSQIDMCCRSPATVKTPCTGPPPPPRGTCPAEIENKLAAYGNSTKQLEQQLGSMECEVRNMQIELANVQRERQQLEQQRKLLKCTGPCAPCGCCPPSPLTLQTPNGSPAYAPPVPVVQPPSIPLPKIPPAPSATCTGPCVNAPMGASTCPQQQLRDLREQYARLQDDYKNKLCEVSCLRTDADKLKQQTRETIEEKEKLEIKLVDVQERLKAMEAEKEKYEGFKEQMVEQEQALIVFKQRFREAQDELEELRSLIQDQAAQLEDYRNKYLQAQQQVEEQRRQLDLMEMDNARMNENVTLEIGRVKNQFQEKLAELAPLPDILKQTQVKLQEAQQMRLVAERNCEDLSREVIGCKDKIQTLQNQLDVLRQEHQAMQDERGHGSGRFDELERKNTELRHENERMKNTLARFEEHDAQLQKRIDEKMHEVTQLTAMLEQVREDSARQVARTKERCETMRRSMQGQIAEMERQLAQCRATARAAQKDRDEIRQKMQGQINNLNEAFEQAQGRIRSLQGHVNYLKTSYSNIFKGQGEVPPGVLPGETGFDSCDCNY